MTTIVASVSWVSFSRFKEFSCLELPLKVPFRWVAVLSESALTVPLGYMTVLIESETKV